MENIIIDKEFWDLFPEAQINILLANNINNKQIEENNRYFSNLLEDAAKRAKGFLVEDTFSQNRIVDQWRAAFKKFKSKKGARSSIEALLKRVNQDKEFSPINPLVDIYNSVSLNYAVPCGGEDINSISGNLHLGMAKGGEQFLPLGSDQDAPALPGEIIYYDNQGAVCRCLNWREAQRTMLTTETTHVVLFIESINEEQINRANHATDELKQLIDSYFDINSTVKILNQDSPYINL
jgi:DNA/RNA-binding domain of Phe-tRNA-synthetase-like protein